MTKLFHCSQVVKPRCRQSAFSLGETELTLHQPVTEEIYTLSQKWQEKEHHLNYYTLLGLGFFVVFVCFVGDCLFCFLF